MPKAGQRPSEATRDAHNHALRPTMRGERANWSPSFEKPFVPDWAADPSLLPKRPPGKDKKK